MNEWLKGSVNIIVNGNVPYLIASSLSKIYWILSANYLSLSEKGLVSLRWSWIFSINPSTVVKTPPKVP